MIENAELVMQMLEMYQMYKQQVPVELEEYLRYVAKTGNTLFQWTLVKPFIREKIMNVIAEFAEQSALSEIPPYPNVDPFNYEAMKNMLLDRFDTFNGPPFTIQRLCELLSCPRKEYNRVDKFMRAVEKNILVVSTCELRPKREEPIVNGVPIPDRWENGKESDISMDLGDKNNVITDASVLNGDDTVESLLNELESMKTPESKIDESKMEHKDQLAAQVTDKVEPNISSVEPKQDTPVSITQDNTPPQSQITDSTEVVESVVTDVPLNVAVEHEAVVDPPKELNSEVSEIQPFEVKEQVINDSVEDLKDVSQDKDLENVKPKIDDPNVESNKLGNLELISTDADRVEGSIIHQTPDSDNKVEIGLDNPQTTVVLEKSDEDFESMDVQVEDISKRMNVQVEDVSNSMDVQVEDVSKSMDVQVEDISKRMDVQVNDVSKTMDVQVEDVSKSMESKVICDNVQKECTTPTEIQNDKQQDSESTVDVPTSEPSSTNMDVEPEKIENDVIVDILPHESVAENKDIQTTEPNTIVGQPQIQDEKKLTESE